MANRNCRSLAMCSTPSSFSITHIAQGFQVALDEAGDDLDCEAAVLALLDDPLADYEFHKTRSLIRPSSFAPSGSKLPAQSICRRRAQFALRAG
jgi:hypothetical protein